MEELLKEDFDVEELNIPVVEPIKQFDATQYEGRKVKIARVRRDVINSHYVPEFDNLGKPTGNNIYDINKTVEQQVLSIETEIINEDKEFPISVAQRFNLQEREFNGKKEVYISKHPKARLWKFMRKLGAEKPIDLIGKYVMLKTEPDSQNPEKLWLRIVE